MGDGTVEAAEARLEAMEAAVDRLWDVASEAALVAAARGDVSQYGDFVTALLGVLEGWRWGGRPTEEAMRRLEAAAREGLESCRG